MSTKSNATVSAAANFEPKPSRRELLSWVGHGLGGAALAMLFGRDRLLEAAVVPGEASDPPPHHPPRAKRAIHIFCCGGVSQVDSFDYKPSLDRLDNQIKVINIVVAPLIVAAIGVVVLALRRRRRARGSSQTRLSPSESRAT